MARLLNVANASTGHNALYATKPFRAGDVLVKFGPKGPVLAAPNMYSVQLDEKQVIYDVKKNEEDKYHYRFADQF